MLYVVEVEPLCRKHILTSDSEYMRPKSIIELEKLKKINIIPYFNSGLFFSLITNSWLHIRHSRNDLDFSNKIRAVWLSQCWFPCLFACLLCDPWWYCTPEGGDVLIIHWVYKSHLVFAEPAACKTKKKKKKQFGSLKIYKW